MKALVAVVAMFVAGSFSSVTLAQKAALVQSVDEPGRMPYQFQVVANDQPSGPNYQCQFNSQGFGVCTFVFPSVPVGKRLVIMTVAATATSTPDGPVSAQLVIDDNTSSNSSLMQFPFKMQSITGVVFGLTAQTYVTLDAGVTPRVVISGANGLFNNPFFRPNAILSGYYINPQ